jgi:hypothetical protein
MMRYIRMSHRNTGDPIHRDRAQVVGQQLDRCAADTAQCRV